MLKVSKSVAFFYLLLAVFVQKAARGRVFCLSLLKNEQWKGEKYVIGYKVNYESSKLHMLHHTL